MKTMQCDQCETTFSAATFGEWVEHMKPHYAAQHADVMNAKANLSDEEKKNEMMGWMRREEERFNALPEEA